MLALFPLFLLVVLIVGGLRRRRYVQSGRASYGRMARLLPRTAAQRRLAAGVSMSAGVVEEAVFRGLLIASGVGILGVPLEVAALLSLALFAWGHMYQGRAGLVGATLLGILFTGLYIVSGSILLPAILHTAQDLIALLIVVPPESDNPTNA